MRVLMISKACVVGAYQRKLEELARLDDLELTVVVPPSWRTSGGEQHLEQAHTTGYSLQVLPIRFNGRFHIHHYGGLGRLMRSLQPHLLHVDEEPYNLATAQAIWWGRRVGARILFFTWQNLSRRYPPPFRWMEQYAHRSVQHVLAGNQEAREVLRQKGYTGPITILPQFGVDPAVFHPEPNEPNGGRPFTVGYAGRLVPEKGVEILLRAIARLPGDWQLRLAAEGPLRAPLEALAGELDIHERVEFAPYRPSTEMPDWYRSLDALVLPSIARPNWKEQFGRVLVEAMSCGVPVVGAESGEIPHVIGPAGLTFPEGDVDALWGQLQRLQRDAALRRDLKAAGPERVLQQFTQAQIAARTYQIYRSMLNSEPSHQST